jgi:hypothetical protein
MFRHANGVLSANQTHSQNGSSTRLLRNLLGTKAALRNVRRTYLNLVASNFEAANELHLAAGREVSR